MKVIKQNHNECVLATLCTLAEVDYQVMSAKFKKDFNEPWWNVVYDANISKDKRVKHDVELWVRSNLGLKIDYDHVVTVRLTDIPMSGVTQDMLAGRGQISAVDLRQRAGHSVAFEDGRVYDSRLDIETGLMDFETWTKSMPTFVICRINRIGLNGQFLYQSDEQENSVLAKTGD